MGRRFQAFAGARDSVRLAGKTMQNTAPGRLRNVASGRKARALGFQYRFAQQCYRMACDFALGGGVAGAFEHRRNRPGPYPCARMNVIDLERHTQRVPGGFDVSGDDIVGVQLPPGFDWVAGAPGCASRAAYDAPDRRIAGRVCCLLADALRQRVVLRVAGRVGERQNRHRGGAGTGRRHGRRRRNGRRGFARRQIPCGRGPHCNEQHRKRGGSRNESASRRGLRLRRGGGLADLERIGAHRFGDVFQRHRAQVGDRQIRAVP